MDSPAELAAAAAESPAELAAATAESPADPAATPESTGSDDGSEAAAAGRGTHRRGETGSEGCWRPEREHACARVRWRARVWRVALCSPGHPRRCGMRACMRAATLSLTRTGCLGTVFPHLLLFAREIPPRLADLDRLLLERVFLGQGGPKPDSKDQIAIRCLLFGLWRVAVGDFAPPLELPQLPLFVSGLPLLLPQHGSSSSDQCQQELRVFSQHRDRVPERPHGLARGCRSRSGHVCGGGGRVQQNLPSRWGRLASASSSSSS